MIATGFMLWKSSTVAKLDIKTGCPITHVAPVAHTIVLVDETDRLSRDDLAYTKSVIMNEYYWLPIGGRLTVRNIVPDPDRAEDIIICRMDDGSDDPGLLHTVKKLRQDFNRIVGARLDELLTALRVATPQKSSPILEYISAVFDRPNFGPNIRDRRLVIISDMLQHSALFSQYGRRSGKQLGADARSELERDMHGVNVRIHYIRRPNVARLQSQRHRDFWTAYLKGMGANVALGHTLAIGEDPSREVHDDEPE